MSPHRARRAAAARLARVLVVVAASGAAIALGLLVRSCDTPPDTLQAPIGTSASPPATPATTPVEIGRSDDRPTSEADGAPPPPRVLAPLEDLRTRFLTVPVKGVRVEQLVPSFDQARGESTHEAIDILAPAGTPVLAVESGRIAKLFISQRGGITIYQFDPLERFAYYYAHLAGYADGLVEGQQVRRGETIGYVGVSGNAPPDTPHLHFAIFELGPEKRWWEGQAVDPFLVWTTDRGTR